MVLPQDDYEFTKGAVHNLPNPNNQVCYCLYFTVNHEAKKLWSLNFLVKFQNVCFSHTVETAVEFLASRWQQMNTVFCTFVGPCVVDLHKHTYNTFLHLFCLFWSVHVSKRLHLAHNI